VCENKADRRENKADRRSVAKVGKQVGSGSSNGAPTSELHGEVRRKRGVAP
jgi:hypothetical protein